MQDKPQAVTIIVWQTEIVLLGPAEENVRKIPDTCLFIVRKVAAFVAQVPVPAQAAVLIQAGTVATGPRKDIAVITCIPKRTARRAATSVLSMATGQTGVAGQNVPRVVVEDSKQGVGHALIRVRRTEVVIAREAKLRQPHVTRHHVRLTVTGEDGAHGIVLKPAEVATSTGVAPVPTQLLRTGEGIVQDPHSRSLRQLVTYKGVQLMESGVLGAVGQSALRLVEVATKSENEPALIQPLRTVVVDAKDQTISRRAVTVNCAPLSMVSGVPGANGRSAPNHVALASQKGNDSATTHHLKMTADLVSETVKKHGDAYGSIVPQWQRLLHQHLQRRQQQKYVVAQR